MTDYEYETTDASETSIRLVFRLWAGTDTSEACFEVATDPGGTAVFRFLTAGVLPVSEVSEGSEWS